MRQREHIVIPVFYEVDPSDVQHLKGNYAIEVPKWRNPLVEISNLSGFHSMNSLNDAKFIDTIVLDVSLKLSETCPSISNNDGLFGIDSSVKDVEALLHFDPMNDVRIVGIWGMGGIGKTTIASKVFDRNKKKFHGHCFVSNVREMMSIRDGRISLRDKIIFELLQDYGIKIGSPFSIDYSIQRRLQRIKVLIVLDDVYTCMQIKSLMGNSGLFSPDSFCPGSRIILTSRDSQVLKDVKLKSDIYQVKELEESEALQLFSWNAFGQNHPRPEYAELSEKVVRHAHGVPLALVVLGSELKFKTTSYWENSLKKFSTTGPLEIQEILRISFDGLDQEGKSIFLDIACFFKGNRRDYVENVLEAFGFHANIGIERLVDKSLIKEEGRITMHDLIEQMGQEIVEQEKDSRQQQSRLWKVDAIKDVLTNNRETKDVEAISLSQKSGYEIYIRISHEAFIPMCKLRFLKLDFGLDPYISCPQGLEFLPDSIRYIDWVRYPLEYWPSNYNSEKLVELHLCVSQLKELTLNKPHKNLKCIDLSTSYDLIRILNLDMAPTLEVLQLAYCLNLVEIGGSIQNLTKLDIRNCISLSYLPEIPFSIVELNLESTGIRSLPLSIKHLKELQMLDLTGCKELEFIPDLPLNLKVLYATNCSSLETMPAPLIYDFLDLSGSVKLKEELASSFIEQFLQKVQHQLAKVHHLCVYGSRMPEWMMYRNDIGSSVSLELETPGHSVNFIFCAVVSSIFDAKVSTHSDLVAVLDNGISETCHYFSYPDTFHRFFKCSFEEEVDVFIWNCSLHCKFVKEVSFKLIADNKEDSKDRKVIKCGVHLIS